MIESILENESRYIKDLVEANHDELAQVLSAHYETVDEEFLYTHVRGMIQGLESYIGEGTEFGRTIINEEEEAQLKKDLPCFAMGWMKISAGRVKATDEGTQVYQGLIEARKQDNVDVL